MTEHNYTRLVATKNQILRKCANLPFRQFGNKAVNLQAAAVSLYNLNREGKVNTEAWQALHAAMMTPQELDDFRSYGLNEGDQKSLEELVAVNIKADYKELDRLREVGEPSGVAELRNELDAVLKENKELEAELERMRLRERLLGAAQKIGPEAVNITQQVIDLL